jgi:hypothetical protein
LKVFRIFPPNPRRPGQIAGQNSKSVEVSDPTTGDEPEVSLSIPHHGTRDVLELLPRENIAVVMK